MNTETSKKKFFKEKKDCGTNKGTETIKEKKSMGSKPAINPGKIKELSILNKELEEKVLRLLAETENLRKRHKREISENQSYAIKSFAFSLLSVCDNFQRAFESIPTEKEEDPLINNLLIGIKAVEKDLFDAFEKNGIKKFTSLKEKFNPEIHQAVSKSNSEEVEKGYICKELQLGFMIGERLLRPAMVVVSEGPLNRGDGNEKDKNEVVD